MSDKKRKQKVIYTDRVIIRANEIIIEDGIENRGIENAREKKTVFQDERNKEKQDRGPWRFFDANGEESHEDDSVDETDEEERFRWF